jgi:hypothetical protein
VKPTKTETPILSLRLKAKRFHIDNFHHGQLIFLPSNIRSAKALKMAGRLPDRAQSRESSIERKRVR